MIRRCQWCKNGIAAKDPDGTPFIICALMPPDVSKTPQRPLMILKGWCGQFRFSLSRWLGYGPRA